MSLGLRVAQCPGCGSLYQENSRKQCPDCSAVEDAQIESIERQLRRNRFLNNEQVAEITSIPAERIRGWIRKGKIKLYDYPNLADSCDLCGEPTRSGKLCVKCSSRIQSDIVRVFEQERLMKERNRATHSYISKR